MCLLIVQSDRLGESSAEKDSSLWQWMTYGNLSRKLRWWLALRLSKRQSLVPTTDLFRTRWGKFLKRPMLRRWRQYQKIWFLSALENLYSGQFSLSTRLIKPHYLVISPSDAASQFITTYTIIYLNCGLRREYESDLRSNEHYLYSSEKKAWKKFITKLLHMTPSCLNQSVKQGLEFHLFSFINLVWQKNFIILFQAVFKLGSVYRTLRACF